MRTNTLALFIVASLTFAGCGSTPKPGEEGKTTLVFIPKSTGNPYFNQVEAGFEGSATDLGYVLDTQAPATADATSQITVIKDQVQRGVGVIVISANSPDALNEALDQAREKGRGDSHYGR